MSTPAHERLMTLAIDLSTAGHDDLAMRASELSNEIADSYVLADAGGDIPTNAQGIALARFLRPQFRDGIRDAYATVARGGFDLPTGYITVRLPDGYNGGIDREGNTST